MKLPIAAPIVSLAITLSPALVTAAEPTPAQGPGQSDDRLILGASGSTLTGTSGGGSGAITFLHGMGPRMLVGIGGQYQKIADSHWSYASLTGSFTHNTQSGARWSFNGEVHEGSGRIVRDDFDYSVIALGASRSLTNRLSIHLEDRLINVDPSHGNLPKIGLSYVWSPKLLTGVWYSNSVSGNLGTELVSVRMDAYGKHANFLAGGAFGDAAPVIVNIQSGVAQRQTLKQVFLGVGKPFSRAEFLLVADYVHLVNSERVTLSLTCTIKLPGDGGSR